MWLDIYFGCDKIIKPYRPADTSQKEYDAKVKLIFEQIQESKLFDKNLPEILITCGACSKKLKIQVMFRCYYCKVYFCPVCSSIHFKEKENENNR